jgi:MoxR-like ATPase
MKPSDLKEFLTAHILANIPVYLQGDPGIGKSRIPRQVAAEMGLQFAHVHVATKLQEDYGMPVINKDTSTHSFTRPDDLPFVGNDRFEENGVLLADELAQGAQSEQKLWANLINERELHGHPLKPGWAIVATGNASNARAGANRLLSHLSDRVARVTVETSLDEWCSWALANEIADEVIAYVRFRPAHLLDFDPSRDVKPTPRGWAERVSPMVGKLPDRLELEVFAGSVGEPVAADFVAFLRIWRNLPNIDAILMAPDKHEVPTELSVLHALAGALARRATASNFERVLTYTRRMPADFKITCIRDASVRNTEIAMTRAFQDFVANDMAELSV